MAKEEWYYILDKDGNVFQAFGGELRDENSHVAVLEYIFNIKNKYKSLDLRMRNGREFYRVGIIYNTEELAQIGLNKYIHYFNKLNRNVVCVSPNDIAKIITPHQALIDVITDKIPTDPYVKRDLTHLLRVLRHNVSDDIIDSLGIEGSLCFGVSHKHSDIDIIVNGQIAFEKINSKWKDIIYNDQEIFLLEQLPECQQNLAEDRSNFIPYSKEDIIFHENRKNYAYVSKNGLYRKINIVGKLKQSDPLYQERTRKYFSGRSFRPVGLCQVQGITKTDNMGDYIPSIYDIQTLNIHTDSNEINNLKQRLQIDYIIDYVGSYYMQLKKGEKFESVGMLEEIYSNNQPSGRYRISLNHWDGHVAYDMYLKTIEKKSNTYIKERRNVDNRFIDYQKYKGR